MLYLVAGAALMAASVAVFSQAGFVVKNPDFPTYQYQIFDVKEPAPPLPTVGQLPTSASTANSSPSSLRWLWRGRRRAEI